MNARPLGWIFLLLCCTWHLGTVLQPPDLGGGAVRQTLGRDFASYYYAARVTGEGSDPYRAEALSRTARRDGTRRTVHPFVYPPPALLLVAWAPAVDLVTGYRLWFWLQEICVLGCALVLWRWWRPLGTAVPVVIGAWFAAAYCVPYGLVMGQVNPLVLLLVLSGLWAAQRGRSWLGGALLGFACMIKMSPVLFVGWWAVQRRWGAVMAAVVAALGASVIALAVVDADAQIGFYTTVLPGLASGEYSGLVVKIGMFANHSLPNLWDQIWPGQHGALSSTARAVGGIVGALLLAGLGWRFRTPTEDPWRVAAQVSAVGIAALLLPVYTYEHHLVMALPAGVLVTTAVAAGRLGRGWGVAMLLVALVLALPLAPLKALAWGTLVKGSIAAWCVQEVKLVALLVLLAGALQVDRETIG